MSRVMLRKEHRSPVLSSISLLGGGLTAWILAEFPGKILDAAYYGSSQPVLQEFIWRGACFVYDMTYMVTGFERLACLATSRWRGRHWRGPIARARCRDALCVASTRRIERRVVH